MRDFLSSVPSQPEELDITAIVKDLIDTYEQQITKFAFVYVRDWGAAQEITQNVFIKVYEKYHTFEGKSNIKTWIYTITANESKDYLRSMKSKRNIVKRLLTHVTKKSETNTPESIFMEKETSQSLAQKVLSLPLLYREVIILYYYENLSSNEISDMLEVSPSTIRTRLERARKILKDSSERSEYNE
ncbi:sigma-70 family RNA polymerase sigma factor [Fredinandcohnia sp. 179-A 10B2 NHS]|uniref:sigma-70 family RNA polymerase sigma factor n=1 Tax=Fredinandcohnia sp. 179-A 10B2 NHS TaxID=3235176 RepID=UPI0039A1399D